MVVALLLVLISSCIGVALLALASAIMGGWADRRAPEPPAQAEPDYVFPPLASRPARPLFTSAELARLRARARSDAEGLR